MSKIIRKAVAVLAVFLAALILLTLGLLTLYSTDAGAQMSGIGSKPTVRQLTIGAINFFTDAPALVVADYGTTERHRLTLAENNDIEWSTNEGADPVFTIDATAQTVDFENYPEVAGVPFYSTATKTLTEASFPIDCDDDTTMDVRQTRIGRTVTLEVGPVECDNGAEIQFGDLDAEYRPAEYIEVRSPAVCGHTVDGAQDSDAMIAVYANGKVRLRSRVVACAPGSSFIVLPEKTSITYSLDAL